MQALNSLGNRSLIIERIVRKDSFRFSEWCLMGFAPRSEARALQHCAANNRWQIRPKPLWETVPVFSWPILMERLLTEPCDSFVCSTLRMQSGRLRHW